MSDAVLLPDPPLLTPEEDAALLALRGQACFFTGHRAVPKPDLFTLSELLEHEVESLVYQGFTVFYSGAARGFDLMAAAAVLKVRQSSPGIRLILIIPCPGQTRGWDAYDRRLYHMVCSRGEQKLLSASYTRTCMQNRNRFLVDHAAAGVAYLTDADRSGTAQTVRYAASRNIPVINLASMIKEPQL